MDAGRKKGGGSTMERGRGREGGREHKGGMDSEVGEDRGKKEHERGSHCARERGREGA